MINSLAQSLANTPYNAAVIRDQKSIDTKVTPIHQASSSNYSAAEKEFDHTMSIYELKHKLATAAQDRVNDKSADIQIQKQSIWQFGVQQHYIDSQKAVLNAYVVSATGESSETSTDNLISNVVNASISDKYMALIEQELKFKYVDAFKPDRPEQPSIPNDKVVFNLYQKQSQGWLNSSWLINILVFNIKDADHYCILVSSDSLIQQVLQA